MAEFIEANVDAIVDEWVAFARTINVAGTMDLHALRDHAAEILRATVDDMRSAQTEPEREAKGKGRQVVGPGGSPLNDASAEHAANRLGWGFDVMEVVSEYRALRASVMRLWARSEPTATAFDVDDITRFNESIDQSLAKTIRSYSRGVEQARDTFLGILGHDLRNPLSAISVSTQVLRVVGTDSPDGRRYLGAISDAVREMTGMIGDLLDLTRTRLGDGIPIDAVPTDLGRLAQDVLGQFRVVHTGRTFRVESAGDLAGRWDGPRLRQALANLLGNACRHGAADGPVTLSVDGTDPAAVRVAVHNEGEPIPAADLPRIFDPMARGAPAADEAAGPTGGVGLGLFIAREVARAHGGTIDVASAAGAGTTFTIRLPRRPPASGRPNPPAGRPAAPA